MSRKIQHVARLSTATSGKIAAIDFAASGHQEEHHGAPKTKRDGRNPSPSTVARPHVGADSDGCASDDSADEDTDGSQSDSAEADNEEDNDEDFDVQAPSDIHFDSGEGQTGHYQHEANTPEAEAGKCLTNAKLSTASSDIVVLRSSTKDETNSDDDYNGVDLISESGDEEPALEHLEEKAIIDSEEDNNDRSLPVSPPNSPTFSLTSADLGNTDPWLTEDPFFAEQINLLNTDDLANDTDVFRLDDYLGVATGVGIVPRRRVRFADPLMLPSENEELASLEPSKGRAPSAKASVTGLTTTLLQPAEDAREFVDDGTPFEGFDSADNNDAKSSSGSSSGYETDQGETTDEEDVPASATTRPSALLRHSTSEFNNRLASQPLPKAPTSKLPPGHRWGPTLGSWVADPTKPIALVASSGKQLIVYPAQRPASRGGKVFPTIASSGHSSTQASPRTPVPQLAAPFHPSAPDESEMEHAEMSSQETATPMLGASPNLMMAGLGLVSGNLLSGHALGPPEAFFPFHSIGADGKMVLDGLDANDDDYDDDDGEDLLNIEDFIDFGEDSEDSDHEDGNITESLQSPMFAQSDQTDADVTPTASPSGRSSVHSLLDHLDRGKVTAFRRGQRDHDADVYRHSSSSSFQFPNAIKANAFVAASSLSPPKKRKLSDDYAPSITTSPGFTKRRMVDPH